ncbi:MAG: glycosyltransferase [Betaproteobacteria bacterium]|nr:glycosyltransferase [Betaproteobacteria bacterium]
MKTLSVIIPSRTQDKQIAFLERSTRSIREQTAASAVDIKIVVAVDQGKLLAEDIREKLGITCVESHAASQAAALNAGINAADGDYIAFLEDDDQWCAPFLEYALCALESADFVSSTQAEYDERDIFLRVQDFPTPSSWLMPKATLKKVGPFDETFRFHLDNAWLGRLSETGLRRIHLVESTAPVDLKYAAPVRPWLANVVRLSNNLCRLSRHTLPTPLVNRLVHSKSGMARIAAEPALQQISIAEQQRLANQYKRIPW